MPTNVVLDADVKARAVRAAPGRPSDRDTRTRGADRSVAARQVGIGPSRRAKWRSVRRGAPSGDRSVVAQVTATPQARGEQRDQPPPARPRPATEPAPQLTPRPSPAQLPAGNSATSPHRPAPAR